MLSWSTSRRHAVAGMLVGTLASSLWSALAPPKSVFTPEQFGAAGDGVTDDYAAFRAMWSAVNRAGGGYVSMGARRTYYIGAVITADNGHSEADLKIIACDGLVIDLNGSKLDMRGDFDRDGPRTFGYPGLSLASCSNVVIRNGELDGNVQLTTNSSRSSEAGSASSGIRLAACSDVRLENLYIHHFQVDGIQIRDAGAPLRQACRRVTAVNVRCVHNGRQGMSIVALRGGSFRQCEFSWTGFDIGKYRGHSPQAGVDIEPSRDTATPPPNRIDVDTGEIDFIDCRFENNRGAQYVNGGSRRCDAIRLTGCRFIVGSGSIAGSDALIFGAPNSSMTQCEIDLGTDATKRLYLGTNSDPQMRRAQFSFSDNIVHGAGMLIDIYAQGGGKLTGRIEVERNQFTSTRRQFNKNPVIRNLGAAADLHFRENRVFIPKDCYGREGRHRPVVHFGSGTHCTSNFYSTDLQGSGQEYFIVRYGFDVVAVNERFAGTRPGPADTIRPNGDPLFDTRTPFNLASRPTRPSG